METVAVVTGRRPMYKTGIYIKLIHKRLQFIKYMLCTVLSLDTLLKRLHFLQKLEHKN